MKVLFVDHECHTKTKSTVFLVDILRRAFDVTEHYYARPYKTDAERRMNGQDVAVILEYPVSRNRFFFLGKRNVFVPMYDNEWASYWQWKRISWSGMGVVSFCGKVSAHARKCGVTNLLDVRYFLDPNAFPQRAGDPKRVFLWERGEISRQTAETLFPPSEGYSFVVKGAKDFWPREQYLDMIASCGIVIAPRKKEGIGMAFLEAMAMGKCVAAHNDATMNEYIEDGKTGILFDASSPSQISETRIQSVQKFLDTSSAQEHLNDLYRRWLEDAGKVNDFIVRQPVCRPSLLNRVKLSLSYPLYLIEGAFYRIVHG